MRPMRRLVPSLVAILMLGAALSPAVASDGQGAARTVHLPQRTEAEALAVGPEGNLWFAGSHRGAHAANVVGRIVAGGALDERRVPESGSVLGVSDLTLGPDGNMWFTEPVADRILFESPAGGNPGELVLPNPGSRPTGIVTVGDEVWVTLEGIGRLAKITPATASGADYTLPPGWRPSALALGSDQALWLVDAESPQLARKPPAGRTITYPAPNFSKGAKYSDIVAGPDGKLWISQSDGPYIDRLEAEASNPEYKRFELPIQGGISIVSNGPHHDIWFAMGGRIGSIDAKGRTYGAPACAVHSCAPVEALAEGHEGALWFAAGGTIGRFEPPSFSVSLGSRLAAKGETQATIAIGCSGGAAGQRCQGKLELLPPKGSGGRLGSARFGIPTSLSRLVTLSLSRAARTDLALKGKLPVRLVARLGGTVVASRNLVLHAA
jgi:streptogramin lyase